MQNCAFWSRISVSLGPSPDLQFLHAKQRVLDQNYKSLWVPDLTSPFCMQNSLICTRISSLYGFQHSSVVMSTHNSVLNTIDYIGSNSHLSFCACKSVWLAPELLDSMGPSPHVWFLDAKQQLMDQNNKTLWVPDITCRFVLAKQLDLHQNVKFIWVPALICVFFHAKQRLYDQTYKCVWVPDLICGFEHT